jgi:hypothetical protein
MAFLELEWGRDHDGMSTASLAEWHVRRVLELFGGLNP